MKYSNLAISLFFNLVIFTAFLGTFFNNANDTAGNENRNLTKFPVLSRQSLSGYPSKLTAYFNDHFGYRDQLIRLHQGYKFNILKESSSPKVVIGNNGWLFYARSVSQFRTPQKYGTSRIKHWKNFLTYRKQFLDELGIKYVFTVAPDKVSIYPENLAFQRFYSHKDSAFDQFLLFFNSVPGIDIIDIRAAMMAWKKKYPLYYKSDTHWNDIGGYVSYVSLFDYLHSKNAGTAPLAFKSLELSTQESKGKELAKMIGQTQAMSETSYVLEPFSGLKPDKRVLDKYMDHDWPKGWSAPYMMTCKGQSGKAIVIGDSFYITPTVIPKLLSRHFDRTMFFHRNHVSKAMFEAIVKKEKPQVVIEQIVERNLWTIPRDPS